MEIDEDVPDMDIWDTKPLAVVPVSTSGDLIVQLRYSVGRL